jgi:hypothetical protein
MKRILTIISGLLLTLGVWADGGVSGKVVDKEAGDIIDFANVVVTRQGSTTPVDGTVTDYLGMTSNGTALLVCGTDVWAVSLP